MADYKNIEKAIIDELIAVSVFDLNEDTCGNDLDTVFPKMMEQTSRFGCLLTFGGAGRQPNEAFAGNAPQGYSMGKGRQWTWRIFGSLLIRYTGDTAEMETTTRIAVDQLRILLQDNRRLGNLVPFADIVGIDMPEALDLNDTPFYVLGFTIEVWDKT